MKHSTYSALIIPVQAENEHYEYMHFGVNGRREMRRTFEFFANEENFIAANIPMCVYSHLLRLAVTSFAISFGYKSFPDEAAKNAFKQAYYEPIVAKIATCLKGTVSATDFSELLSLLMSIPMSSSDKKDYIVDKKMVEGADEWVIRKQLNASVEAELDIIISNWEKAEALGAF